MKTSFCVICGAGIVIRYSLGRGINYPICKNRGCLETYMNFRKVTRLPRIDKSSDQKAYIQQRDTECYDGFCGRCGKPIKIDFRNNNLRHASPTACENASTIKNPPKTKIEKIRALLWVSRLKSKPKPRIYLKPWQDPESLFCDTEFLETEILRKKIRPGKECSDNI